MAEELQIALVQSALAWENPAKNRLNFSKKIATIAQEVDLIVLPEMFTTGFSMQPANIDVAEGKKTLLWLQETAKKFKLAITGSIIFKENDKFYNRLFFVHPDGKTAQYDKRHTFTLAGEHLVYEAGTKRVIINYKGFKICPLICYDLRFPVWARNTFDYDLLIYVANWPKPRIAAWDALLQARAIENMSYCVGVNIVGVDASGHEYCGHSSVYDALGKQLAFSDQETIMVSQLSKSHIINSRSKLKFLEDRDRFTLEE